ncbi:MAG: hypothetical protein UHD64_06645 [Bacteroidales bacterium]|nr:hypothetical protein [Bacteroidales bacterium]
MAINESVYGSRDNWIVPGSRTEQGATLTADVYYYDDVADNDNLKIKIANYNTVGTPITTMRSQINGSPQATGDFIVNNNWDVTTSDGIDKTICQFGIGGQSGLSNQEYWYTYYNDTNVTTMLISDNKDIINVAFGLKNNYRPHVFTNRLYLSPTVPYDNGYAYEQGTIQQTWGMHGTFSVDASSTYGYLPFSGYADAGLITQIPIKNLKISPVIIAYNSNYEPKTFESISGYLAERQTYNKLCCIKIKFRYARSTINDFNGEISINPFFVDDFIGLNGLWGGNNDPYEWSDSKMHWFYRNSDLDGFIVAGRPPYGYDDNYNRIPWYDIYYSTTWSHDSAIGGIVYQTPDFKFVLDDNNCFTCDVSNMSDDDITKGIRKQLASFGLFFVDGINDINLPLDDEKTFLGILEDGVAYGKYSNGSKNREQDQWNWDTMEENIYDPSNPPKTDPNTYENTSGFNPAINAPDGFNKRYVLSELDIRTLREDFFRALESKPEDIDYINFTMSEFLTNNPIDCIVSLKWFPFTVPSHGQEVNINLGNYQTNVQAPVYTGSGVEVYSLGSCVIYPYAGSGEPCFLDYAPYTKMELIIPYCGTVELDPSIYMNHTLSVNFIVDIYTGACTAYIMCDGLVSDSVSGVCCVDLPISGIDNATLEGQIYNASLNLKSSKIGEAVSVVSGGLSFGTSLLGVKGSGAKMAKGVVGTVDALTGAIGSVAQSSESLAMNQYQIEHINIPFRTVGSQTGLGNAKQEQFCRLLIYRPKFINGLTNIKQWYNSNEGKLYGHTVGYSCIKTDTISSFHGFTMFSNADLSGINATDTEKSAILTALQSGVILP